MGDRIIVHQLKITEHLGNEAKTTSSQAKQVPWITSAEAQNFCKALAKADDPVIAGLSQTLASACARILIEPSPGMTEEITAPAIRPRRLMRRGGRGGTPIKPQRQAEGPAAAAQERAERRGHHAVAALLQPVAEGLAAAGQHDGIAKADRVGSEAAAVLGGNLDTVLRYDALAG